MKSVRPGWPARVQRLASVAQADTADRRARFDRLRAELCEKGKALGGASLFDISKVIEPADTRPWRINGWRATPPAPKRDGKTRAFTEAWRHPDQ